LPPFLVYSALVVGAGKLRQAKRRFLTQRGAVPSPKELTPRMSRRTQEQC